MDDLGEYEVDDLLLYPRAEGEGAGPFVGGDDWDSSREDWERLGEMVGDYGDISDSESVGSLSGLLRGYGVLGEDGSSDGSVSEFDIDEDEEKRRHEWEHIRSAVSSFAVRSCSLTSYSSAAPIRSPLSKRSALPASLTAPLLDLPAAAPVPDPSPLHFDPFSSTMTTMQPTRSRRVRMDPSLQRLIRVLQSMRWSWCLASSRLYMQRKA